MTDKDACAHLINSVLVKESRDSHGMFLGCVLESLENGGITVVQFAKVIAGLLLPPGLFVMLLLSLGVLLLRSGHGLGWLTVVIAMALYTCSIPLVGRALLRPLEHSYRPPARPQADVIVMLGGGAVNGTPNISGLGNLSGAGAQRLLTTALLYHQTKLPIIVSGGRVFADDGNEAQIARQELMALDVPAKQIVAEDKSRNTMQNALYTKEFLAAHGWTHPLLVTSAFHMKRAVIDFHRYGVIVTPYPCGYLTSAQQSASVNLFMPSTKGLSESTTALHEYLGIIAAVLHLQ
jgi:uncharacterized SAM-binding protein YcdF (DUF218 family)